MNFKITFLPSIRNIADYFYFISHKKNTYRKENNAMENKEQTKDYLIIRKHQVYNSIEIRFRELTEELYDDLFRDYLFDDNKAIFEYHESLIKNFTWENFRFYLAYKNFDYELYRLFRMFDNNYDGYFYPEELKLEVEKISEALKNIKNTRTYKYECEI